MPTIEITTTSSTNVNADAPAADSAGSDATELIFAMSSWLDFRESPGRKDNSS